MKTDKNIRLSKNTAGIYEIRWTEKRVTKRVSCQTRDIKEAYSALARFSINQHKMQKPDTSVAQILSTYEKEHVDRNVVDKERQRNCMNVLRAFLGDRDVNELTPDVMNAYMDARRSGKVNGRAVGDGTLRREMNCLASAINHSVRTRRISASDVPHITLPRGAPPKDLWLTAGELDAFIGASEAFGSMSRVHRFVVIASETAARKNSILTLRWSQVDMANGVINYQNDGNHRTNKRRVAVPMSENLMSFMKSCWDLRTQDEWVLDKPYSIQRHFDEVKRIAFEATGNQKFNDVTPHTLRHTWASHAAQSGVPMFHIAGVLGDTVQTVMRVYAHHGPDHLRKAVNFRMTL